MNRIACQYAVVRFLPYAETGEFANVGVVLACPETGFFGSRLMSTKKIGRITGFFDQLDKHIYRGAMAYLRQELDRVAVLVNEDHVRDRRFVQQAFADLVRPREALMRFSQTRVILADDPAETLDKLFATLVERDFADSAYHDQLVRGVRETLQTAELYRYFRGSTTIGDEDLHMHVPFVHERDGRVQLAIKPLDLVKVDASQVYKVGGPWVDRIRRLRKHRLLPEAMLLAVGLPRDTENRVLQAADEIMDDLRSNDGVQVVPATDKAKIATFAQRATLN